MLRIYNSQSGVKEPFRPIHAPHVGLYVCGVTVYDYCHIGHARCYVAFDVIRRWLRHRGYEVNYVRNITDIDDKIIRRAAERGEPVEALTARFIDAMHADFAALAVEPPDHEPRATAYMGAIIAMIERLLERGYAYVSDRGDVLYSVAKFAGYGRLSGKHPEDLRAGARVEIDRSKRDPLDFVLWKRAKPGEPHWASPWGEGRPGWHIECSAMASALLGNHFDLHGGGMDLKFPHHENELAQSCAATGEAFVNIWVHNGFVTVDDQKMSKSLGNFFTVREVLPYLRHPEVLRAFLLASHYRGPINYTPVQLEQADAALSRLYTALRGVDEPEAGGDAQAATDAAAGARGTADVGGAAAALSAAAAGYRERFEAALDDDFNTPEALAALQGLARELNVARAAGLDSGAGAIASVSVRTLSAQLRGLAGLLGLLQVPAQQWFQLAPARTFEWESAPAAQLDAAAIEARVGARLAARAARDFAAADRIRAELEQAGVVLEDQPGGTTRWKRG